MSQLVTIFGGSGFVGRYVARRMAKAGWRVRVATRNPNEAMFVRTYGTVGQVEPVACNVRDDASVRAVLTGADAVVYAVGVLAESGKNTFEAVQVDGPRRVAQTAAELGISKMVLVSALGADTSAESDYARTKGQGEDAVLESMPQAVILRPSIVFGPEDEFFNRFAQMSMMGPVLPVVGAETRFQPVYVDDVAAAVEKGVTGATAPGVYALGGPDVDTFSGLMARMLKVINRRKLVINIPFGVANVMAFGFKVASFVSLGLIKPALTADQIRNLAVDNVVPEGMPGLADLGIKPTALESVLPDYLWRFRPSGQYASIKDSAKNLRNS